MTITATNVQVAGPITVYRGAALPTAQVDPTSAVAYGTPWGGTWVDVGATQGGATLDLQTSFYDLDCDQTDAPFNSVVTGIVGKLTVTMTEVTLAALSKVLGVGTVTVGSTETTFGLGTSGGTLMPVLYPIGIEGLAIGTTAATKKYRRMICRKPRLSSNLQIGETKDKERMMQVTFDLLQDPAWATTTDQIYKAYDLN